MGFQKPAEVQRQGKFQRNEHLEDLLREINGLLTGLEDKIISNWRMPKYPVVFVMGNPRCGTTVMMQWLASIGKFCYPSNLLSRFYAAPYIGAKIQQLLLDKKYDFNNEIFDFDHNITFASDIGKTKGALSPNEFWYFWRRFFPYGEIQFLPRETLKKINAKKFVAELAAIEAAFNKPFALKGGIANLNIPFLSKILDKALFLYVKRHPFYNIQSILNARIKQLASRNVWYSFKPREYKNLKDLDSIEQVAGQVYFINKHIEEGLGQIVSSRSLQVSYEDFCSSPKTVFKKIKGKMAQQGYKLDGEYIGLEEFESSNKIRLPERDIKRIIEAYKNLSGEELII